MPTIKELEAVADAARYAHNKARNRIARIDKILAAMTLIDDSLGDAPMLARVDIEAISKCDNAQAFADLTAIRKALRVEIDRLEDVKIAAEAAVNAAPEEAA